VRSPIPSLLAFTLVALGPGVRAGAPSSERVLPFLDDDYAGALAEARTRDVPLFIEAWAPW
jgi:hypothetical protein